ncbi:MAG: M15 family metallopeptidase [Myxococcaceae bacterium]
MNASEHFEDETLGDDVATVEQGLADCSERQDTGYRSGNAFPITVVTVDGKPVEKDTANAYSVMQAAAAADGVSMFINSGFRTMAEQQYLYACYVNCNCNSCNLAAQPGYSNHQSGSALDLNTANGAVFNWLNAHGAAYGFRRTVPSEPWHWEYFGGGPGGGPCSAPPPPPPCDRTAGAFTFSCDGVQPGQVCVNVDEPADPDTWGDNFVCTASDFGFRWSFTGPIAGMDCTATPEGAESNPAIWADNFFCAPPQSPWKFSWSSAGPIAGRTCVGFNEPTDPHTWNDNFLCSEPVTHFENAGWAFSMAGSLGATCVNVDEPSDPDTWSDNFFCSPTPLGMKWSFAGPIAGMRCENVAEGAEALASMWADNFLCVPESSPVHLHWSSAGPIAGLPCVRWFEHVEDPRNTWADNWMCVELRSTEIVIAAAPLSVDATYAPASQASARASLASGGTPEDQQAVHGGCSAAPVLAPLIALWLTLRRRRA